MCRGLVFLGALANDLTGKLLNFSLLAFRAKWLGLACELNILIFHFVV